MRFLLPTSKGPPSSPVQLRIAAWTGNSRDTRPTAVIGRTKIPQRKARSARARRCVFHPDEVAEAEAQGLPYVLVPRVLSVREWMERYGAQPVAESGRLTVTNTINGPSKAGT
jgi:hypothetical protein